MTVAGLVLLVLSVVACGGATPETTTPPLSGGAEHQVTLGDLAYNPQEITIEVGDTVTWTNEGSTTHTVTSWFIWIDEDDEVHIIIGYVWDSGDIKPEETYSRTFDEVGIYHYIALPLSYYFSFEDTLKGTVIVKE